MKLFLSMLFLVGCSLPPAADALIVTAPLQSSQPIINPSAAATRITRGVYIRANQDKADTEAVELTGSTFDVKTELKTADLAASWSNRSAFSELNASIQKGEKVTDSQVTSSDYTALTQTSTKNDIQLVPAQWVFAYKHSASTSFGFKQLVNFARYQSSDDFTVVQNTEVSRVISKDDLKANFSYTAIGMTYALGAGFYFGSAMEGVVLQASRRVISDNTRKQNMAITRHQVDQDDKRVSLVLKQDYGLGFLQKFSSSTFRFEVSYERMPPIDEGKDLSVGERARATVEGLWSIFHLGAEATTRRGYFVDANSLVPYFFNYEHFSDEPVFDYRVFGGFRSAKGHGFGASVYKGISKLKERLALSDPTVYAIKRESLSYGLSYTYFF